MARIFFRGQIVGEPDPVTPTIDWVRSELDFAKGQFTRAEKSRCLPDRTALSSRISALREVLYRMERELS
jgi:hypothetical protein